MIYKKRLLLITLLATSIFISGCLNQNSSQDIKSENGYNETTIDDKTGFDGVKEFTIIADEWSFTPSTIIVNQHDLVRLHLISNDVTHSITFDYTDEPTFLWNFKPYFDEYITVGETTTVEFFASQVGNFRFFCDFECGFGHDDMAGVLIVK